MWTLLAALAASPSIAFEPTEAEARVILLLSGRDGAPPCETLDAELVDPVASYARIVEHVAMPPWAPMQAARCLTENHFGAAEDTVREWLVHPDKAGLATLALARLHKLPASRARGLATDALRGPHRAIAERALSRSPTEELRQLVPAISRDRRRP